VYVSQCRAYLPKDPTARTYKIRLSARRWAVVESVQRQLAEERGVRRVSLAVALSHILDHLQTPTKATQEATR
jgi:hypothetical protein